MQESKQKKSKQNRYEKLNKLGEGTYGLVSKVYDHENKQVRALKKIKFIANDEGVPVHALRQIAIVKRCKHPNIVKLHQVHYSSESNKLYLIFQFVEQNLYEHYKKNYPLSPYAIKSYIYQLLSALAYLHVNGIMHRDIKPQNILIDSSAKIKLGDFGQSKLSDILKSKHTPDIATLWYRAPEILFGSNEYTSKIDIWAVGCIMGQLIKGQPLIHSDCEVGQIFEIMKKRGSIRRQDYPNWRHLSPYYPKFPKVPLDIERAEPQALDILQRMLQTDPQKRIGAFEALKHSYFNGYC